MFWLALTKYHLITGIDFDNNAHGTICVYDKKIYSRYVLFFYILLSVLDILDVLWQKKKYGWSLSNKFCTLNWHKDVSISINSYI